MRSDTIARNYAEVLLALAGKAGDLEGWGRMIRDVADAVEQDQRLHRFLDSPRVSADAKAAIIIAAFGKRMPRPFVRFLETLVRNRRQMLLAEIAQEYQALVDETQNRVRARVTLAAEPDSRERDRIAAQLTEALGMEVVPTIFVNPRILGGVVVRVGDTVMDGSVVRRLAMLRNRMLYGGLPAPAR